MDNYFERLCEEAGFEPVNGEELDWADQAELVDCLRQFTALATLHASTRKPGHEIEIGFFKCEEVNAFAATWEGKDAIAISWGMVTVLRQAFKDVMSEGDFPWIPTDKRADAATWLFECSKFFVFVHELGHVWNGHTSLLVERGVVSFIQEIGAFGDGKLGNIDRQTMEMDADGFAAANLFRLVGYNRFPVENIEIEQTYGAGATRLAMVAFAIYFVFRLFDQAANFDEQEQHAHPSPPLRQSMIAGALAAQSAKDGAFKEEIAWDVILSGATSAEKAYARQTGRAVDDTAFQAALTDDGNNYVRKLLRHWHVLRPQLDLLKRGGILPATQEVDDDD